jgi:hypothetical protein
MVHVTARLLVCILLQDHDTWQCLSLQSMSNNSDHGKRRWVYERRWSGGRRATDSQDSASSSISTASAMSTSPPTDKSSCRARDTANLPGNKLGDPRRMESRGADSARGSRQESRQARPAREEWEHRHHACPACTLRGPTLVCVLSLD